MRMTTVAMKPIPSPIATSLRRFLSRAMFLRYPVDDVNSSDVIKSMIAVTASQRLMSDIDSGNDIFNPL